MSPRSSGRIRTLLASWVTFLLIFTWLPLVRVIMDGDSYRWATTHFGRLFVAQGWEADAWILVVKAMVLVALLWGLLRSAHAAVRLGAAGWLSLIAVDLAGRILANPAGFVFRGDTLGLEVNITWPAVLLTIGFAALALFWAIRPPRPDEWTPPRWSDRNRRRAIGVGSLLLVLLPLLALGEPHGRTDQIGVLLTISMVPLLAWALAREEPQSATDGRPAGPRDTTPG